MGHLIQMQENKQVKWDKIVHFDVRLVKGKIQSYSVRYPKRSRTVNHLNRDTNEIIKRVSTYQ